MITNTMVITIIIIDNDHNNDDDNTTNNVCESMCVCVRACVHIYIANVHT